MSLAGIDVVTNVPSPHRGTVTFVILAGGELGDRIARLADNQAAFDRNRRRIMRLPLAGMRIGLMDNPDFGNAVALILGSEGDLWGCLDERRATTAAWIEDAFLRATTASIRFL
jgi:hypothetical protein